MYLVIGATGNIGGELVKLLLNQGETVRAFVRDASRAGQLPAGIDIAVGDLDDAASLTAAARGIDGVFFLQLAPVPPQAQNMVDAAQEAGVRKIVVLSSIGTVLEPHPVIGGMIAQRDKMFRRADLDITYLRPNTLMSNALGWAAAIRDEDRVTDATDPGKIGPVDPFDIARVAALVLTEAGHAGHGYILNGPEALTAREQVEILAAALGRPIEFAAVTPEQFAQQSIADGTPTDRAAAVQNLNELFQAGRAGVLADDITNLTAVAPRTFREWCELHADAFK
jgi:uncharacterized protein YbjT (DUF2867 family)